MVYAAKGGFWLILSHAAAVITTLLLSVAFANLLPKESYGLYKFVLSLAAIVGAFSLTGMGIAVTRAVARGFDGALRSGTVTHLRWGTIAATLAFALATYYFINGDALLGTALLIVATFVPLTGSASLYSPFLVGKKDFKTNSMYAISRSVLPAIALVITLFLTDNPLTLIFVFFASHGTMVCYFYLRTRSKYRPASDIDDGMLSYGKHLSVMSIVGVAAAHIDKVLIFHFLGAVPLAIYAFALAPVDQLRGGNKLLQTLVLPKLSARTIGELRTSIPHKMRLFFLFAATITAVYVFIAPFLYGFLFPQYTEAVFVSQLYALTLLFMPVVLLTQTFVAHQKKKELYVIQTAVPIFKILLLALLLPLYGIVGVIAALLLGNVANLMLSLVAFRRLQIH